MPVSFLNFNKYIKLVKNVHSTRLSTNAHSNSQLNRQYIHNYSRYMLNSTPDKIRFFNDEKDIPLNVSWYHHLHKLHPIAYNNDLNKFRKTKTFKPSIDFFNANSHQKNFLNLFANSEFANEILDGETFFKLFDQYYNFLKLAKNNSNIVPTFEIDVMWHAHMNDFENYKRTTEVLCGRLLNHNDDPQSSNLGTEFTKTKNLWFDAYKTDYTRSVFTPKTSATNNKTVNKNNQSVTNNQTSTNNQSGSCSDCSTSIYTNPFHPLNPNGFYSDTFTTHSAHKHHICSSYNAPTHKPKHAEVVYDTSRSNNSSDYSSSSDSSSLDSSSLDSSSSDSSSSDSSSSYSSSSDSSSSSSCSSSDSSSSSCSSSSDD